MDVDADLYAAVATNPLDDRPDTDGQREAGRVAYLRGRKKPWFTLW